MGMARNLAIGSLILVLLLVALLQFDPSQTTENSGETALVFYCAAGMKPPVSEIVKQYEKEYGVKVQVDYGGSGTLLNRLEIAGKGDLYLAADYSYLEIAQEKGLVEETLAVARLTPVIAVKKDNPQNIESIADLLREDISYAMGNPEAASIGRTVQSLLEASGDWQAIESNAKVFKPTVNDIANDIKIGTVDAGIIWDAVAAQYEDIEALHVPELDEGPQQVTVGILKSSKHVTKALRFARYLTARDKGLIVFEEKGYKTDNNGKQAVKP